MGPPAAQQQQRTAHRHRAHATASECARSADPKEDATSRVGEGGSTRYAHASVGLAGTRYTVHRRWWFLKRCFKRNGRVGSHRGVTSTEAL